MYSKIWMALAALGFTFFASNSFAGDVTKGTADLVYAHAHFSMIKIYDGASQQMYEHLTTPVEKDTRYPFNSKKSIDGRMVCEQEYQKAIGEGTAVYECWIAFDSSDGSIGQTWK